jgi:hypothetical protein
MISPETGETLTRGVWSFRVAYKGKSVCVDMTGYYHKGEGDGVHEGKDIAGEFSLGPVLNGAAARQGVESGARAAASGMIGLLA